MAAAGLDYPELEIDSAREMYGRSALKKHGLTSLAAFFSETNLAVLAALRNAMRDSDVELTDKLLFAFTAILPRASKRYQWSRQRPLNASNQTYYVAPVFYEWSVFDLFLRKVEAIVRSDAFIAQARRSRGAADDTDARYVTASATDLTHIADESIDYVFTDPPFGSNIFYSDMNLFAEAWLGELTDPSEEAVVHTTKARKGGAKARYEDLLGRAFTECWRVLRAGAAMTVVFANTDGKMWSLLQRSLLRAGFDVPSATVTLLDKGQRSVKGLASGSEAVLTCDAMVTVRKRGAACGTSPRLRDRALVDVVADVLMQDEAMLQASPSRVYIATVREHLRSGWDLDDVGLAAVAGLLAELGYEVNPRSGELLAA